MATKKKYTRRKAVDLNLAGGKPATQAQETGPTQGMKKPVYGRGRSRLRFGGK